jgi:hypothetical protein
LSQIYIFLKSIHKNNNHKLNFKENIAIIITTTNYNFEETFESVLSEQSKIGLRILATLIALGK